MGKVAGQVGELVTEAQVRLVRAEPGHGIGVGDLGDRPLHLVSGNLGPEPRHQVLGDLDHVFPGDERHLDVDLGELGLPVGPEVLVPEAADQLVVALQAGDHQQLLEQLRRLRQRVPAARPQPDGHQEIARALRRGPGQERGLHVHEAAVPHQVADQVGGRGPGAQRGGHLGPPDVEVAVAQPHLLAQLAAALHRERQRVGLGEHLHLGDGHLYLAGGQLGVLVAGRPPMATAMKPKLVKKRPVSNSSEVIGAIAMRGAVVAAARYPARQRDLLPCQRRAQRAGLMGADHRSLTSPLCVVHRYAVSLGAVRSAVRPGRAGAPIRPVRVPWQARAPARGRPGSGWRPARRRWWSAGRARRALPSHPAAAGTPGRCCP